MNLQEIMDDASTLVPNSFQVSQRILWLNELNRVFFEVVKIPKVHFLSAIANTPGYALPNDVTFRNIDRVMVGTTIYRSYQLEDVPAGNTGWTFDDTTHQLTLDPAPAYASSGHVRYMQASVTTFIVTAPASQTPDAPVPYQSSYVLGLAERMALALDDIAKASNYGQQYRALLAVAQSNYSRNIAT